MNCSWKLQIGVLLGEMKHVNHLAEPLGANGILSDAEKHSVQKVQAIRPRFAPVGPLNHHVPNFVVQQESQDIPSEMIRHAIWLQCQDLVDLNGATLKTVKHRALAVAGYEVLLELGDPAGKQVNMFAYSGTFSRCMTLNHPTIARATHNCLRN